MHSTLERELLSAYFLKVLDDHEFTKTNEQYYAEQFGDVILQYESPEMKLQVTRDKGVLIVYVSAFTNDEWLLFENVLGTLGLAFDHGLARALHDNYKFVADKFSPQSAPEFLKSEKAYSRALFEKRLPGVIVEGD